MVNPATPQPRRGLRRRDKVLIGCALGCAAGVLLVIAAFFAGLYWLVSPGDQVATEGILSDSAAGYLRLPRPGEDEGLMDLLTTFVLEAQRIERASSSQDLPAFIQKYQELNARNGAQGIRMWLPKDATLTFEDLPAADSPSPESPAFEDPTLSDSAFSDSALSNSALNDSAIEGPDLGASASEAQRSEDPYAMGRTHFVAAVNLRSFPRAIRSLIAAKAGGDGRAYRGHTLHYMEDSGVFVAFFGTTLLVSGSEILLDRAIDRLEKRSEAKAPKPPPDDSWDAYGSFEGARDPAVILLAFLLEHLPEPAPPPPALEGGEAAAGSYSYLGTVDTLHLGLDVLSADVLRADLTLDCTSEDAAAHWAHRLSVQGPFELGGVDPDASATAQSTGLRTTATFELSGLRDWLIYALEKTSTPGYDDLLIEAPLDP